MKDYVPNKDLKMSVHNSLICSSHKLETTQKSVSKWMHEQNVILPCSGFNNEKEWATDTCYKMNESQNTTAT